jgi:hypothetical protein
MTLPSLISSASTLAALSAAIAAVLEEFGTWDAVPRDIKAQIGGKFREIVGKLIRDDWLRVLAELADAEALQAILLVVQMEREREFWADFWAEFEEALLQEISRRENSIPEPF